MAQVIGNVKSFEAGTFFAKSSDGQIRQLKMGDSIYDGENVYGASTNGADAKIIIDVMLAGAGDLVIGGNGALTFDTSVLAGMFSHHDAVVYVNSVKEALATVAPNEAATSADTTDAGETAAGTTVTDTERAGDIFAARTGAVGDVTTNLNQTGPTSLSGVQVSSDNPIILEAGTPNTPSGNTIDSENDALTTQEDTALTIAPSALLANDIDPDGDTLTIISVQGAVNGTVSLVGGNIVFTPTENYNGDGASFTYTVSDGKGGISTATVNVAVTPVNDVPIGEGIDIVTSEDTSIIGALPAASDADGDAVTYALDSEAAPTNGTVVINPDGTYTYTPDKNFSGSDSFNYTVSDGQGGSNSYEVGITVNPVSDAPNLEVTLDLSDNLPPVYVNEERYNLHSNSTSTGVIELEQAATSALVSLKSYKVDVDDGTVILRYEGAIVKTILIDEAFPKLHNEDKIISIDAGGVLFDSIEINSIDNSEFKVEGIRAYNSNYEYTLSIDDASLNDNETLGTVTVTGLPEGAVLVHDSYDDIIVPADGTVTFESDMDVPASWSMTLNHELPEDTSIVATLTSTDGDAVRAVTVVGVYGDNDIAGEDGNDILSGGIGNDSLSGGDGNDILVSDVGTIGGDSQVDGIDGENGIDTLVLTTESNIDFDSLNSGNNPITNVEAIDLSLNGDYELQNISHYDILDITGGGTTLTILGDTAVDTVTVDNDTMNYVTTSTEVFNGVSYDFDIYTSSIDSTVTLRVENTDAII